MKSFKETDDHDDEVLHFISCWAPLKLKFIPWRKSASSSSSSCSSTGSFSSCSNLESAFIKVINKQPKGSSGFRYDPLSYSQNFDDGTFTSDHHQGRFSSRYAAAAPSLHQMK